MLKRAFKITADRRLSSVLVPEDTRHALRVGDRITVDRPIILADDIMIDAGERGRVDYINASTGAVEVLMAVRHTGLDGWDNHILIEPFETDDINGDLRLSRYQGPHVSPWALKVGASCALGLIVAVAHSFFMVEPVHALYTLWQNADESVSVFARVVTLSLLVTYAV